MEDAITFRRAARAALTCAGVLSLSVGLASAQSLVSTGQSFVEASLIPGETAPDGSRTMGLALDLAPGWKTYWRSPGEAGIPPRFDWEGSANLARIEVLWPAPGIYQSFGMTTIGYESDVVLPIRLEPEDASAPVSVSLALDLGVCREICVFERVELSANYAPDMVAGAEAVATAVAAVPAPGSALGLSSATCSIRGSGEDRDFSAALTFDQPLYGATVLLEGPEDVWFHGTHSWMEGDDILIDATATLLFDDVWITRKDVRMTVLADGFAADIQGCLAPGG
ncbi:MAG: protein-disulfide reductase DsbD domain-containing protein [Pseudomonadota bacterium]